MAFAVVALALAAVWPFLWPCLVRQGPVIRGPGRRRQGCQQRSPTGLLRENIRVSSSNRTRSIEGPSSSGRAQFASFRPVPWVAAYCNQFFTLSACGTAEESHPAIGDADEAANLAIRAGHAGSGFFHAILYIALAPVAQGTEHPPSKRQVAGSNPAWGTGDGDRVMGVGSGRRSILPDATTHTPIAHHPSPRNGRTTSRVSADGTTGTISASKRSPQLNTHS